MNHVAPLAAPRESVFAVLASSARKMSYTTLSSTAAASGVIALGAALAGRATWMLLSACYVVWCFASWGILFHASAPRNRSWRLFEWTIVGSSSVVCVVLGFGLFYWALGPRWML